MRIEYYTVDVFARGAFEGNPLAVIPDGRGLDDRTMQAVAAEFNYSETTFLLPPADARHTARLRIFNTKSEMPFAGHPNVGTAFICAQLGEVFGKRVENEVTFEELAGLVPVAIQGAVGGPAGATLTAPQPLTRGAEFDPGQIAGCCGLGADDVVAETHMPCVVSVGVPFVVAQMTDEDALKRAAPNIEAFSSVLPTSLTTGLHLYVRTGDAVSSRMFAPLNGLYEDPATGSANAALTALLAHLAPEADLELSLNIAQGLDMGRPSFMQAKAVKKGQDVAKVTIGGPCRRIMHGHIDL